MFIVVTLGTTLERKKNNSNLVRNIEYFIESKDHVTVFFPWQSTRQDENKKTKNQQQQKWRNRFTLKIN